MESVTADVVSQGFISLHNDGFLRIIPVTFSPPPCGIIKFLFFRDDKENWKRVEKFGSDGRNNRKMLQKRIRRRRRRRRRRRKRRSRRGR
jgi:hypothetical protein